MTGSLQHLFAAMLAFVGSHFLLSYPPLRARMIGTLGEKAFRGGYSLIAFALLGWTIFAYRAAPQAVLWTSESARWIPILVMPISLVLAVLGLTTRNVTSVGGEQAAASAPVGIVTVTRHPFLWAVALWALSHLVASGEAAAAILFGGLALLALAGMVAIDHKRAVQLGEAWETMRRNTSAMPFARQIASGAPIDWKGIGWWRPVLGLVLYGGLLYLHGWPAAISAAAGVPSPL